MAVMARDQWTDERLDDLNSRVESIDRRMETGFADMREEFRSVRAEMKGESQSIRQEMATGFTSVKSEFQAVRAEMAAQAATLNQTIYRLFGGLLIAWVVGVIAIIAQT
jgi:hypothetical protein